MGPSFFDRLLAYLRYCAVPIVVRIIALQCAIFVVCFVLNNNLKPVQLLESSTAIWDGQIWRPFTATFTHLSALHLFFNMLAFYLLGRWFVQTLSKREFWVAIIVGGAIANVAHSIIFPASAVLGFSGALMALLTATAIKAPRTQMMFFPAWIMVSILVFLDFVYLIGDLANGSSSNTAYDVHLVGALCGALMVWSNPLTRHFQQRWTAQHNTRMKEKDAQTATRVDKILEKISREGLHKLTDSERAYLKRHSEKERKKQQ